MKWPFNHWFRQYLDFSKKDRNAVLTLSILIFLVLTGHLIVDNIHLNSKSDATKIEKLFTAWETVNAEINQTLFEFNPNTITEKEIDSLRIPDFIKRNIINYRNAGGKFYRPADVLKIYGMTDSIFSEIEAYIIIPEEKVPEVETVYPVDKKPEGYFDPNTAGINVLGEFGFNSYQAENLVKYREKGGAFYQPGDILKIYGVDSAFFLTVVRHIQIKLPETKPLAINTVPVSVELNNADSTDLVKIRGIGPVFASRIIKYRALLGGFYSTSQLLEVYGFPEETFNSISSTISVDTLMAKKIRINFVEFPELLRHPYFNKSQVEAILSYRNQNGPYKSNIQILELGLVDSASFWRINPYLTCR